MQKLLPIVAIVAIAGATCSAARAADIGISVSIGEPGFYGRIDIGGYPPPQLLSPQAVMVQRVPPGRAPIYLRVPPGHARHWAKYCDRYHACGERVYFVTDDWYEHEYAPHYRGRPVDPHERGRDPRGDDRRPGGPHDERAPGRAHDRDDGPGRGRD